MPGHHTLIGTASPTAGDGKRIWRFAVDGPTRGYYEVSALNRQDAEAALDKKLAIGQSEDPEDDGPGIVTVTILGVAGLFVAHRAMKWFRGRPL